MQSDKPTPYTPLTPKELEDLRYARSLLENPGFAAKVTNLLGAPIERGFKLLPQGWNEALGKTVRVALDRALDAAMLTLGKPQKKSSEFLHKMMVGASGGLGGALGFATMAIELPISTTIMLRSIADIARSEGHDLKEIDVRLNCLEVFALGAKGPKDPLTESSYWVVRAALSKTIAEAATHLTGKGASRTAPSVVRFLSAIASRFGVVVSEEAAAKAVPVVGAAAGAVVNVLFMDHFQNMARGHFIVRRLEKKYGQGAVESAYLFLK